MKVIQIRTRVSSRGRQGFSGGSVIRHGLQLDQEIDVRECLSSGEFPNVISAERKPSARARLLIPKGQGHIRRPVCVGVDRPSQRNAGPDESPGLPELAGE